LYTYGAPHDLHSFPTRRSSDLKTLADIIFRLAGVDALRTDPRLRRFMRKFLGLPEAESDELEDNQALLEARERDAIGRALAGRPDRKSTRLNSSHVKISYAVFC